MVDPFSLIFYVLIWLLLSAWGLLALVLLLTWAGLLLFSKKTRATTRRRWLLSTFSALVLLPLAGFFVNEAKQFHEIYGGRGGGHYTLDEPATRAEPVTPAEPVTLAEPTTLAGIQMPAGTKLELPRHNSVGTARVWGKPAYFEKAQFPGPVVWQGMPIVRMERALQEQHDNLYSTIGIAWSTHLKTWLAEPREIDGLHCGAGAARWRHVNENGELEWPDIDAAAPAPAGFRVESCQANGQTVRSENNALELDLPQGSQIDSLTSAAPAAESHEALWLYLVADQKRAARSELFLLRSTKLELYKGSSRMKNLWGIVEQGTDACPMPPGTIISWQHERGDIFEVRELDAPSRCGSFRVELRMQN